jgi:hypothetical protein
MDSCLVLDTATGETKDAYAAASLANSSPLNGVIVGRRRSRYRYCQTGRVIPGYGFRDSPVNGSFLQERDYRDIIVPSGCSHSTAQLAQRYGTRRRRDHEQHRGNRQRARITSSEPPTRRSRRMMAG